MVSTPRCSLLLLCPQHADGQTSCGQLGPSCYLAVLKHSNLCRSLVLVLIVLILVSLRPWLQTTASLHVRLAPSAGGKASEAWDNCAVLPRCPNKQPQIWRPDRASFPLEAPRLLLIWVYGRGQAACDGNYRWQDRVCCPARQGLAWAVPTDLPARFCLTPMPGGQQAFPAKGTAVGKHRSMNHPKRPWDVCQSKLVRSHCHSYATNSSPKDTPRLGLVQSLSGRSQAETPQGYQKACVLGQRAYVLGAAGGTSLFSPWGSQQQPACKQAGIYLTARQDSLPA